MWVTKGETRGDNNPLGGLSTPRPALFLFPSDQSESPGLRRRILCKKGRVGVIISSAHYDDDDDY